VSDQDLSLCLDELESMLQSPPLAAEALAAWQERFTGALASAERGADWDAIVSRAKALAARMDTAADNLTAQQGLLRKEMADLRRGNRALKAYRPS